MLVSQAEDSVLGEAVLQDPTEVLESVSEISEAWMFWGNFVPVLAVGTSDQEETVDPAELDLPAYPEP